MNITDKIVVTSIMPKRVDPRRTVEVIGKAGPLFVPLHHDWEIELRTLRGNPSTDPCFVRAVLGHADGYYVQMGDVVTLTLAGIREREKGK